MAGSRSLARTAPTAFGERLHVHIDDDVRVEFWTEIRGCPGRADEVDANL